jgi:hypothetical protein
MTYDHAQCAVDRLVMLADLRDLIQLLDRRLAEIQLEYPLSEFAVSIDKLRNQTLDLIAELQKSLERSRVPPHSLVPRRPVVPQSATTQKRDRTANRSETRTLTGHSAMTLTALTFSITTRETSESASPLAIANVRVSWKPRARTPLPGTSAAMTADRS